MTTDKATSLEGLRLVQDNIVLPFGWSLDRIARRAGEADLTFWVYYGADSHIRADMPPWLHGAIHFFVPSSLLFLGEYPSEESGVRVLAVSMFGRPEKVSRADLSAIIKRVVGFNTRVGGLEIVPGGILPNRLAGLNLLPADPISIANDAGPVYGITGAVENEFVRKNLVRGQDPVGIMGVGRIGARTMRRLREIGHRVVAIEENQHSTYERGRLLYSNRTAYFLERNVQVLVVITRRGDDIAQDIDNIPQGCTIFDETFPPIGPELVRSLQEKGCTVARIFLTGIHASRAFGGYGMSEVPACLVQPMVRVAARKFAGASQRPGEGVQDWVDRVAKEVLHLEPNTIPIQGQTP